MGSVIAGWAAGHFMAIVFTVAVAYLLVKVDTRSTFAKVIAPEVPRALLAVPFFIGAGLVWSMIGLGIGSLYEVGNFAEGGGGLGAPNMGFALGMLAVGVMPVPVAAAVAFRFWWLWLALGLLFAVSFGWAMPLLAEQW